MRIKKLCLALILGTILSACGSSNPEDVALDFTEKVFKGDEDALEHFDLRDLKADEKEFANGKIRSMVASGKEKADKRGGVKKIIVGKKDIKEDRAEIETIVIFGDDSNTTEDVNLVKKDGKWFIR